MRNYIINFLRVHPTLLRFFLFILRAILKLISCFIPIKKKTILFASFGGRNFDDSPKALYDEICSRQKFNDWSLIWAFVNPEDFSVSRGKKIKIDTPLFFFYLLACHVWISNSEMDRGLNLDLNRTIRIETWHGTPLKKICSDQNSVVLKENFKRKDIDDKTIRCAQSEYDRAIFMRLFHASKESFLLCDLPRNDSLFRYSEVDIKKIKDKLEINNGKKIILYVPTYREYLTNKYNETFLVPPITLDKWKRRLSEEYVLLIRAHYAVHKSLDITTNDFVKDVSKYPCLNDLYIISDILISDYSSCYFDYSILERPMFCFAYDKEEYIKKRGLYLNLEDVLPCPIDEDEDSLLQHVLKIGVENYIKAKKFHNKFTPNAGNASRNVIDCLLERIEE